MDNIGKITEKIVRLRRLRMKVNEVLMSRQSYTSLLSELKPFPSEEIKEIAGVPIKIWSYGPSDAIVIINYEPVETRWFALIKLETEVV